MIYKDETEVIRVRAYDTLHPTQYRAGTVIGSYEGTVGILLDNGEYVDVPEAYVREGMKTELRK